MDEDKISPVFHVSVIKLCLQFLGDSQNRVAGKVKVKKIQRVEKYTGIHIIAPGFEKC